MTRIFAAGLVALACSSAGALAAGSNIGLTDYPAPKCEKPALGAEQPRPLDDEKPSVVQAENYNAQVRRYNTALQTYNAQMGAYNTCIQGYMENGNADMRRIKDALDAAVASANAK